MLTKCPVWVTRTAQQILQKGLTSLWLTLLRMRTLGITPGGGGKTAAVEAAIVESSYTLALRCIVISGPAH